MIAQDNHNAAQESLEDTTGYSDALNYLSGIAMMGIQPELDTVGKIYHHLQWEKAISRIPVIQVAGTNGKGSTVQLLSSILQTHRYRVGTFTSPHLEDVRERVVIDGETISAYAFVTALTAVKITAEELLQKQIIQRLPTYFEYTFLIALYHFIQQNVQIIILEVGLGGRWDATSIVTPSVSVITTIAKDHTAILGKRLADIASEKAGIIKPRVPVVCGCLPRTIGFRVIKEIAHKTHAPFYPIVDPGNHIRSTHHIPPYACVYSSNDDTGVEEKEYRFDVHLNGIHQIHNAAIAVKTLRVLQQAGPLQTPLQLPLIAQGIAATRIAGRIETIPATPPVILDGGHNEQSTQALAQFLKENGKQHLTLIFGVLSDKKYIPIIKLLKPYIARVIITRPLSERALSPNEMVPYFKETHRQITIFIQEDLEEAYRAAMQFTDEILVTGSFYLVGALRRIITNSTRRV